MALKIAIMFVLSKAGALTKSADGAEAVALTAGCLLDVGDRATGVQREVLHLF